MVKWGTPTMGGLLIILVVLGIYLALHWPVQGGIIAPLATLALVGLLGAVDDYLNARTGEGIRARQKLLWQTWSPCSPPGRSRAPTTSPGIRVPFVGDVSIDPVVYIPSPRSRSWPRPTASTSPTASTASPAARWRSRSCRS